MALYKGCPSLRNARIEASKTQITQKGKTYAQATQQKPIEINTKIEKPEKVKIMAYTAELVKACFQKVNLKISLSDIANYSATLALSHLDISITGEQLFEIITKQVINIPLQSPTTGTPPSPHSSND